MNSKDEMDAAILLARLKQKGFSVFAQYDYLKGIEFFKGVFISPSGPEAKCSLERIIEILTSRSKLAEKKK